MSLLEHLANLINPSWFVARREAQRAAAVAAFKAAIRAKDTRAQHRACVAAMDATTRALRAEVR